MASPSHLALEVATQPTDWLRSAERGRATEQLPAHGMRVAALGCGTSMFMSQAYAELREAAGHGVTDAFSCSEHHLERGYDFAVVISRSGTTTEVIEVIDWLTERGVPHVAIVATPGTPVAERAQATILMDDVDEQSVVQTRFATSTLALLRGHLGHDLSEAAAQAQAILDEAESTAVGTLRSLEQLTFLGRGWTVALAQEAGLKLRESAQFWTEAYSAMEYRHGPISISTDGRGVWAFGEVPEGLADQVAATGAHFEHRDIDPMADLVRLHRLCLAISADRGLDPDQPRSLSRSIILT